MSGESLIDIEAIKNLASNPTQMAIRLLAIEKRAKQWNIGTDPARRSGLVEQLKSLAERSRSDPEESHSEADDLLLEFINDEEISELYGKITKYYS